VSARAARIIFSVLFLTAVYAILRYNVFKGVEWTHFPLYVMNKIFSFTGFILLVLSFALEPVSNKTRRQLLEVRKYLGRTGFLFIIIHVLMSLLLLRPETYGDFFAEDRTLSMIGEWSMLLGALAIATYLILFNGSAHPEEAGPFHRFIRSPAFLFIALIFSSLHITIMGFKGWLVPAEWPAGMPPITMASIFIFLSGLFVFIIGKLNSKN